MATGLLKRFKQMAPQATSWPEWACPEWRNTMMITSYQWMDGRRADDGAEGLWRVHDELYDLTDFISSHPGGPDWLTLTKGTDVTEAFEVHHLGPLAETTLPKFHVRSALTPRNSPFTFHETGFYRTLKARVFEILKHKSKQSLKSLFIVDALAALTVTLSVYASARQNYLVAVVAGLFLCFTTNCSHNFLHQSNNWRMYYFNMSLMSVREWRVIHSLSHHLYANTWLDLEMAMLEPWLQWLPRSNKHWIVGYFSTLCSPFVYTSLYHSQAIRRLFMKTFLVQNMIGLLLPALMMAVCPSVVQALLIWTVVIMCGSFCFGAIGVNAGHHHPDIFHDGDAPRLDRDWGMHQMDAVGDRKEFRGSLLVTLVSYGQHTLHHLFPTVDHDYLEELHPVLAKTCEEFGCALTIMPTWQHVWGQFRQLGRSTPNQKSRDQAEKLSDTKTVTRTEINYP